MRHSVNLRSPHPHPQSGDSLQLLAWRNEVQTRAMSISDELIPTQVHEQWYEATMNNPQRQLRFIQQVDNTTGEKIDIGAARLEIEGEGATVHLHIAPLYRGQGKGKLALEALGHLAFNQLHLKFLRAWIKPENRASLHLFEKAGFHRGEEDSHAGLALYEKRA